MKVKYWVLYLFLYLCFSVHAESEYCFRVYLKNKGESGYSIHQPEAFLSEAALQRRFKNKINVSETDLPISAAYLDSLKSLGTMPVTQSKWLSTVVISTPDSSAITKVNNLSIVDSVKWVWKGKQMAPSIPDRDTTLLYVAEQSLDNKYGYAQEQIDMLNGVPLHEMGYTGEGISIAVIDAGFSNVDRLDIFDLIRLKGTFNAVKPGSTVFEGDDHGTKVLACMAANRPGVILGTAPLADYWLIKSEDSCSEFPIEEDYWAAAVEFADSVGVDIITSSLGYYHFDREEMNYEHASLDGQTAFITRAAKMAAEKGILVFCSAGNEGNSEWGKITFPSDASDIITVGAINAEGTKSSFSSKGFTADYRVKPDVVALGTSCAVVDEKGMIRYVNGTSFSTPIVAGMGACLWQAFPSLSNLQMVEILRKVSSHSMKPDAELGYGVPDMMKAYELGNDLTSGL